jgi:hypothetical protein
MEAGTYLVEIGPSEYTKRLVVTEAHKLTPKEPEIEGATQVAPGLYQTDESYSVFNSPGYQAKPIGVEPMPTPTREEYRDLVEEHANAALQGLNEALSAIPKHTIKPTLWGRIKAWFNK